MHRYTVIIEPEVGGGYSIHCPGLPGCHSQGKTVEESLSNIKEAMMLVVDVIRDKRKKVPEETAEIVAEELRQILTAGAEDGLQLVNGTIKLSLLSL
jgi:antitoxin HicB